MKANWILTNPSSRLCIIIPSSKSYKLRIGIILSQLSDLLILKDSHIYFSFTSALSISGRELIIFNSWSETSTSNFCPKKSFC